MAPEVQFHFFFSLFLRNCVRAELREMRGWSPFQFLFLSFSFSENREIKVHTLSNSTYWHEVSVGGPLTRKTDRNQSLFSLSFTSAQRHLGAIKQIAAAAQPQHTHAHQVFADASPISWNDGNSIKEGGGAGFDFYLKAGLHADTPSRSRVSNSV